MDAALGGGGISPTDGVGVVLGVAELPEAWLDTLATPPARTRFQRFKPEGAAGGEGAGADDGAGAYDGADDVARLPGVPGEHPLDLLVAATITLPTNPIGRGAGNWLALDAALEFTPAIELETRV